MIRKRIIVQISNEFGAGLAETDVAGMAQTVVSGGDQPDVELPDDGSSAIGRSIINNHHLEIRVVKVSETLEALPDGGGAIIGADNHREGRPVQRRIKGRRHKS